MEIYKKMSLILKDVEAVSKGQKNTTQGWTFRGIDDMYNALHDLFAKHEVFLTSDILEVNREERKTNKGGNLIYTIIKIKFSFNASDGSSVHSIMLGEAMDSGDKSANKAMSIALKYALMQAFLIPTVDLIDSDKDTYEESIPVVTKKALPPLNEKSKHWEYTCEKYAKGEVDISKIKETYSIDSAVEEKLQSLLEEAIERQIGNEEMRQDNLWK